MEVTRERFKLGLTNYLDVAQAETQKFTTESDLPTINTSIEQSIHRFGILPGQEPNALKAELAASRPLDAEGDQWLEEPTENVGTRHRSVYSLCQQIPGALEIVLSQDGDVRFIKRRNGQITYWEQAISFALKLS